MQEKKYYQIEAEKLKEELVSCNTFSKSEDSPVSLLELVDIIDKFGLSSYFEVQNKVALEKVMMCIKCTKDDLYTTALCFRLLREHGYYASQGNCTVIKIHEYLRCYKIFEKQKLLHKLRQKDNITV